MEILFLDCQEVAGCQDMDADNYNELATDAGDCNYNGCMDASAQNYEAGANVDDGSCTYLVTFRINMSNEMVADEGVHMAGSFQGLGSFFFDGSLCRLWRVSGRVAIATRIV